MITCVKDSVRNDRMCNNNLALVQVSGTYPNMPKILKNTLFGMVETIYSITHILDRTDDLETNGRESDENGSD